MENDIKFSYYIIEFENIAGERKKKQRTNVSDVILIDNTKINENINFDVYKYCSS